MRAAGLVPHRSARWRRSALPRCGAVAAASVVLTTGTELQRCRRALDPGRSRVERVMLAAALGAAGAAVERLRSVQDDAGAHREALAAGARGRRPGHFRRCLGGPHDLVRAAARELGVEEVFWGVAVKPGKPVSFGVRGATLVFGLPGNPVSSLVAAELFVLPALGALQGAAGPGPYWLAGVRAGPLPQPGPRRARPRANARGRTAQPLAGQELAHDRAGRGCGRAGPRSSRRGELPDGAASGRSGSLLTARAAVRSARWPRPRSPPSRAGVHARRGRSGG